MVGGDIYPELFRLPDVRLLVEIEEENKHERVMKHHKTSHRFWVVAVLNE